MDTVRNDTFWLPERAGVVDSLSPWLSKAVNLRNTQSVSAWTAPTVASVLTGLYPREHGGGRFPTTVANLDASLPNKMSDSIVTLPELLDAKKYRRIAFISNPFITAETGIIQGMNRVESLDTYAIPDAVAKWFKGYRAYNPVSSFFLYVHLMDAHTKHWDPMPKVDARAATLSPVLKEAAIRDVPKAVCGDPRSGMCRRYLAYAVSVMNLRTSIARILTSLEQQGLKGNTAVILFSDHGEEFFDHREAEEKRGADPRNAYGLGHGNSMYQELLRVPLLVWHPRLAPALVDAPTSLLDIFPTAISLLDVKTNDTRSAGISLVDPELLKVPDRIRFASGIAYGPDQTAARWGQWKMVRFRCPDKSVLFNLATDPGELEPAINPEVEIRLARLIAGYESLKAPISGTAALSEQQIRSLQSVGYLGQAQNLPPAAANCN